LPSALEVGKSQPQVKSKQMLFWLKNKFTFLGHVVDFNESQLDPKKIATVESFLNTRQQLMLEHYWV
jgi:hypothetical protein